MYIIGYSTGQKTLAHSLRMQFVLFKHFQAHDLACSDFFLSYSEGFGILWIRLQARVTLQTAQRERCRLSTEYQAEVSDQDDVFSSNDPSGLL